MGVDADQAPDWLQERYEEGKDLEDDIIEKGLALDGWAALSREELVEYGFTVDELGQIELVIKVPTFDGEFAYVVCHPDGLATNAAGELAVVEAKSASPDYAKVVRRELPPFYAWQVSVESVGTSHVTDAPEVLLLIGEKLANEDRSEVALGGVTCDYIPPPYSRGQIIKRVREVERYAREGEVPFCEYRQYPCGYFTDHDEVNDPLWREEIVDPPDEDVEKFDYAVDDYSVLHEAEKEIKKDKKAAAKVIAEFMDRWGAKGKKSRSKGRVVTDVVQKRQGNVDVGRLLSDKGIELSDEEMSEYRGEDFEVRYPMVKKGKE